MAVRPVAVGIFGVLLILIGVIVTFGVLRPGLKDGIHESFMITEPDQTQYQSWVTNTEAQDDPQYFDVTFFNLTNLPEVLTGAKPIYQTVGPYKYDRLYQRFDVQFLDDAEEIAYYMKYNYYQKWPEYSPPGPDDNVDTIGYGDPRVDQIVNINPGYMGILQRAQIESNIPVPYCGPSMKIWYQETLPAMLLTFYIAENLNRTRLRIVLYFDNTLPGGYSEDDFYAQWANDTFSVDPLFTGMLPSEATDTASAISLQSAQLLWDPTLPNSVLSPNADEIYQWFFLDTNGMTADLMARFQLTEEQVNMIAAWLLSYREDRVWKDVRNTFTEYASTQEELAIYHACTAMVTNGTSVSEIFPSAGLVAPLEIYFNQLDPSNIVEYNWLDVQYWLYGPSGVYDALQFAAFAQLALQGYFYLDMDAQAEIQETWGVDNTTGVVLLTHSQFIYIPYKAAAELTSIYAAGGDMFNVRTPNEILFEYYDPLIELLLPTLANTAVFRNFSDLDSVRNYVNGKTVVKTGKHHPDQIMQLTTWEGNTEYMWQQEEPVAGSEGMQFQMQQGKHVDNIIWNFDIARSFKLKFLKDSSVRGVPAHEFVEPDDLFDVNPAYNQTVAGFADISALKNGIPVQVSRAYQYGASEQTTSKISGNFSPEDGEDLRTRYYIEPNTGATVQGTRVIQLNMLVADNGMLDDRNRDVPQGVYYPMFFVEGGARISKTLAERMRNTVVRVDDAQDSLLISSLTIGLAFVVGGIGYGIYRRRAPAYTEL